MTTTFATRSEYRAYKKAQASMTANKGRKITLRQGVAAFGLASFLIANAGVGAATAANSPTPTPTFTVSAENQSIINRATADMMGSNSKAYWTGGIQEITISEADRAYLAAFGITHDDAAAVAKTNAKNAEQFPGIHTAFGFDTEVLKANHPEIAALLDSSPTPENYYAGVGVIFGGPGGTGTNITTQAVTPKPEFPINVSMSSPARYEDATHNSEALPDINAYPVSSVYAGGADGGTGGSVPATTTFLDVYANSGAARIADTNSNGQRGLNPANTVNCIIEVDCGFWMTPTLSGAVGNLPNTTIAIGKPVWVSVKTTYAVEAIPEWTEENPFIDAEGNKIWFTPKTANFALQPQFDASVPFTNDQYANQLAAELADAQERKISVSSVELEGSALNASIDYRSGTVSVMTSEVTDGSTPQEKELTIKANNPQEGEDWFHNGEVPSPFFAGKTWTETANNGETVRFTVASMDAGQIVIKAVSEFTPLTLTANKTVIGTHVSTSGVSNAWNGVPTYNVHYLQAETPAPEPETPVVPAPEPEPETPVVPEPETPVVPEPEVPVVPEPETPVVPEPEVPVVPETPTNDFDPNSDSGEDVFVPQADSGEDTAPPKELAETGVQVDVFLTAGVAGASLLLGGVFFYAAKTRRNKHA